MKYLFAIASLMAASMPVAAETTYLVIKSEMYARKTGVGLALIKIPMLSQEQCEEASRPMAAVDSTGPI